MSLQACARFIETAWRDWRAGLRYAALGPGTQGVARRSRGLSGHRRLLGQLAASIALLVPVERIIFGEGAMSSGRLLDSIREKARECLGGYIAQLNDTGAMQSYICSPALGDQAGIAGAFLLAEEAWAKCRSG